MSKGVGEMVRSRSVQVKASAGTEGARRATGVPADGAAGEAGPLAPAQRWSVGRKRDVVLKARLRALATREKQKREARAAARRRST